MQWCSLVLAGLPQTAETQLSPPLKPLNYGEVMGKVSDTHRFVQLFFLEHYLDQFFLNSGPPPSSQGGRGEVLWGSVLDISVPLL